MCRPIKLFIHSSYNTRSWTKKKVRSPHVKRPPVRSSSHFKLGQETNRKSLEIQSRTILNCESLIIKGLLHFSAWKFPTQATLILSSRNSISALHTSHKLKFKIQVQFWNSSFNTYQNLSLRKNQKGSSLWTNSNEVEQIFCIWGPTEQIISCHRFKWISYQ